MFTMYFLLVVVLATASAASDECPSMTVPDCNAWWGDGEPQDLNTTVTPFKIEWSQEELEDLIYRLKHRRDFVPSLNDAAYNYGVNTHTIGHWLDYWASKYDFAQRLAYMNQYDHYKVYVQGLRIHFIWIKSDLPEAKCRVPILILHGFPGSVLEFYKAAKHIIAIGAERGIAIDIVMPSLPGFGFSDYTNRIGLGAAEMGCIFKNLMSILGYERFIIQGGDCGSLIGFMMATFFQDVILGYHSNMGVALTDAALSMINAASIYPAAIMRTSEISRLYPLSKTIANALQQTGYFHIQATEPDTIGIAMSDSPSGLAAWIFQQISTCSRKANINDTRGGLDMYPEDELIDNLMFYWMNNKLPTAFRIYAETFNWRNYEMNYLNEPTTVPTVVVQAKDELYYMPPPPLSTKYTNLVRVDVLNDYGHFLAWEQPKLFAELLVEGVVTIIQFIQENNMYAEGGLPFPHCQFVEQTSGKPNKSCTEYGTNDTSYN